VRLLDVDKEVERFGKALLAAAAQEQDAHADILVVVATRMRG
jgi:hypothetical protein